ncbi:MAG: SDR family NAD(P)-dependent oxidoreductase [Bacteroidales bacterium]
MNYFYVTGTSRGIGKAIAQELLKSKSNYVYGISRHSTIQNKQYEHITLDLNDLESVKKFEFQQHKDAEKVVLVNNAGILGHVTPVGNLDNDKLIQSYKINLISPALLTNQFINKYKDSETEKIIINVSSGAARHTIKSWSTYCSTKSGLEMFARVIMDEQERNTSNPVKVFSIAPGIVDTEMQDEIREVNPENFPELDRFIQLKKEGNLEDPQIVARIFVDVINNPHKYKNHLMDLRDL